VSADPLGPLDSPLTLRSLYGHLDGWAPQLDASGAIILVVACTAPGDLPDSVGRGGCRGPAYAITRHGDAYGGRGVCVSHATSALWRELHGAITDPGPPEDLLSRVV
jgi:hypothetical protein